MRYNELTLFSDLDGTLILPGYEVPRRNLEAIAAFLEAGGHFAIATGRAVQWVKKYLSHLPVNFPCILSNGSVVYDFERDTYLRRVYLPESVRDYLTRLAVAMPWVGVSAVSDSPVYDFDDEVHMIRHVLGEGPPYEPAIHWRDREDSWFKALLVLPPERCAEALGWLRAQNFPDVEIVQSDRHLVEILPPGSSKGAALESLYQAGLSREKTVGIGDFYNDLELIGTAGVGACVAGAPPELQAASRYITGPCRDGAVADLIESLMRDFP